MGRVVIVMGGMCGIGVVIFIVLKDVGYLVVVNYGGNDEVVVKFNLEIGIVIYKWDVGDFGVCVEGVVEVKGVFGLVEILVNNVGIMWDVMFYKLDKDNWDVVIWINLDSCFNMVC